ncbi:VWA-like domain-containing protein [Desulfobotulus sp. H1]|uniref:VWA-like domain-containing protein n=1 Tax=Desulfobotulus pelophilus TaxID=2823377 RepID=A0ABT3NBL5_9BACT|nr:VWA-like domain-containing protein [Desulfobotulus pelophilus]MCW7754352.1 VWA-like domain-containing protein [Desulfobotulus pelophilus]
MESPLNKTASAIFLIRKARAQLLLEYPFFGTVAMGLQPLADPDAPTAWTDGVVLGYRPEWIRALPFDTLKGMVGHLVLHAALGHNSRRQGRDPSLWNMACDHTINWMLLEAGLKLPEGYLDNPEFRFLSAEIVYERILSRQDDQEGKGRGDSGTGEQGDGREMNGAGADGEKIPGDGDKAGNSVQGKSGSDGPGAGAMADYHFRESDSDDTGGGDPGGTGEVRDSLNPGEGSDGEPDAGGLEALVAKALLSRRDCGRLPVRLEREVRKTLEPGMDWRMLLSRFIDLSARNDYAWSPPNRRYLHQGIYLPSVRSEEADCIVIVVDTSGSISAGELDSFCSEVSAILTAFSGEILVMGCDADVGSVFRLSRSDLPVHPVFFGGGGTDFRAPFRWLEKEGIAPRCLVYLTDLACSHYPPEPFFPVLWAVCGEGGEAAPPFGDMLHMGMA